MARRRSRTPHFLVGVHRAGPVPCSGRAVDHAGSAVQPGTRQQTAFAVHRLHKSRRCCPLIPRHWLAIFKVTDPKMPDALKQGDKVKFAAGNVNGSITVTAIEALK